MFFKNDHSNSIIKSQNIKMIDPIFLDCFVYVFSLYLFVYLTYYIKSYNTYYWNTFTYVMSTLNALQCSYLVYYNLILTNSNNQLVGINHLLYSQDTFTKYSLMLFSSYLFTDGLFQLLSLTKLENLKKCLTPSLITSVLHHFVGGYGIYLMAEQGKGLGLALYFAFTEISTPFINLSWFLHHSKYKNSSFAYLVFMYFYGLFFFSRIVSIPVLYIYLDYNYERIMELPTLHMNMVYYGSYTLVALNSIWYVMLNLKALKFQEIPPLLNLGFMISSNFMVFFIFCAILLSSLE